MSKVVSNQEHKVKGEVESPEEDNTLAAPAAASSSSQTTSGKDTKNEQVEENDEKVAPPTALQLLHRRLNRRTELLKLHLKHYHMSAAQLKRRTSELALPKEIHDKYEEICRSCDQCSVSRPAPARARVSGLRAGNFGDLIVCRPCRGRIQEAQVCGFVSPGRSHFTPYSVLSARFGRRRDN